MNQAILSLPYISELASTNIKRFIRSHDLPIRVIFTPGKKLRDIFCSSRPYDKPVCFNNKCIICPNLLDGSDCESKGVIYKIVCNLCFEKYIGEICRACHQRLMEHSRNATSPSIYPDEPMSIHYDQCHHGQTPNLSYSILDRETSTVRRKIKEAFYIVTEKPRLNNKSELSTLERFLV